ncbi:hypothetical protein [Microbacterium marinilacus]|uniref:ATP synthase protein I n=1 Tax=Microbacterium marinilacus TaxID=415209 RepID=A0ABP7BP89_9MICO|nr:hypothetical protein [Microbacterium marinilacus]MBY0690074.1 hypothetical protein [Microbacterium marinilacus]
MSTPHISSTPVLRTALVWGAIVTVVVAAVGGGIGFAMAGADGMFSALAGAAIAAVFMLLTAVSILVANRWFGDDLYVPIFFGVVLGGWLLKLVLFIVALMVLRGQPWIVPGIFFVSLVVSVVASLAIDAIAMLRSRTPYVDVQLPGEGASDGAVEDGPAKDS